MMSLWGGLWTRDWGGVVVNLGTELVGAVATYILLELFIGGRERREAEEAEREAKKTDLIAQMGSQVQDVAIAAAEELRRQGWLYDGSLRGAHLVGAYLVGAGLDGAKLGEADLRGADLTNADLRGADLSEADLSEAYLVRANLSGADLTNAKVATNQLAQAKSITGATMPDGTLHE
jgi:hypothetical protein